MSPALEDGDYVLTRKPRRFTPGLIYVVNHVDLGRIIKRLSVKDGDGYRFEGDNQISTPEALIGRVEASRIVGQVIRVIGKSGLRRP